MAKFAVVFVAALAINAAFAGVARQWQSGSQFYDNQVVGHYEGFKPGQLQAYAYQIQTIANQLSASFQYAHPNNVQTLTWQSRELAQAVEQFVDRLQAEFRTYYPAADAVVEQIFRELREIHVTLRQPEGFVATTSAHQLQYQLSAYVQQIAHQIEKLVYVVQYRHPEAQGSLYAAFHGVLAEFLAAFQHVQAQAYPQEYQGGLYGQGLYYGEHYSHQYGQMGYPMGLYGFSGYGYQQPAQGLAIQLQVVASDLSAALQHVYLDNVIVKHTMGHLIRQYVQHLEVVAEHLEQVSYTSGAMTQHHVAQHLRQMIVSLEQFVHTETSFNAYELKNQLSMYVQHIASELKKLAYGVQPELEQHSGVQQALYHFVTATRNFYIHVQYISQVSHRGQTHTGFGYQIQTLANGLTAALESVSVDNHKARQVLAEQARELAQHIQKIVERIQAVSFTTPYGVSVPQQVATNLRHVVASLQQVGDFENAATAQKLKMHLIANIQEAATEIQKLFWAGPHYFQQEQHEYHVTPIYAIFNDFVATLQNQQVQLYSLFQFKQYGQSTQQLAHQIQAVTNNLAIFFQNAPFTGEHARKAEMQARRLAYNIQSIIRRLEVESMYTHEHGTFQQVVHHLRQLVASLEQVASFGPSNTMQEFHSQFDIVLHQVAVQFQKLAYVAQYDAQYTHGNFYTVVRSVLIQYLNVIQHVQLQFQGINQAVQIGQTPRELALQVQVAAHRLSAMFQAIPDSKHAYERLAYQARRMSQLLEIVVSKLHHEATPAKGQAYQVFEQIAAHLNQIQMSLQQGIAHAEAVSPYQLKMHLAARIQDAAVEIQKLVFVIPYEAQQVQSDVYPLVKSVLMDFLAGLHNMQMQVQDHLQIAFHGQNPRALAVQIQSIAQHLSGYLQYVQPNSQHFRQTLVIQIGEFAQSIEHVVQMLHSEIKRNPENSAVLKQVASELHKISLALQQANGFESHHAKELSTKLITYIQNAVAEFQKLAYVAEYKVQQTEVGFYHGGVLNGVFNTFLATLRNIYVQMQSTRYMGYYGQDAQQLTTEIQTITTHLADTLNLISASGKTAKQALAIQTFRYARHIRNIAERLEAEVSYRSEINGHAIQQVVQHLKQVVVALQQIAGSWTTATTADLKVELVAQIQHANAQIQKLTAVHLIAPQHQAYAHTVVTSVLIEYYAAVQNFHIRVYTIAHVSQKGQTVYQLALQAETAAIELTAFFHHVLPSNKLVGQTLAVEARQLAKVIANIVNKFQSVSGTGNYGFVQQIATQLKQVEYSLQQIAGAKTFANVHQQKISLESSVYRAAIAIQQLMWAAQPELQQVQVGTGVYAVIREALNEFVDAVQNVHIQIQNVVQNGQPRHFSWGWGFQGQHEVAEYPGQYYAGWDLHMQYPGQGFEGQQYRPYGYGYAGKYAHYQSESTDNVHPHAYGYADEYPQYDSEFQHRPYGYAGEYDNEYQQRPFAYGHAGKFAQYDSEYATEFQPRAYGYAGKYDQYDSEFGFAGQYRPFAYGYGHVDQYNPLDEGYGYSGMYHPYAYGYSGMFRPHGYGYASQYRALPYGVAGQYDEEYPFAGQYRPYRYGFAGQYDQYDSEYGFAGKYDSEYGFAGKYDSEYQPIRPYGYAGKFAQYDSEFGYAGQYRPHNYGYAGQYKYDSEYAY